MKTLFGFFILLLCPSLFYAQNLTTVGGTASSGTSGLLCANTSFQNIHSVNTSSSSDSASFTMLAGANCKYWLQSTLDGTGVSGTYAGFHVQAANLANLFAGMEVHSFLNGVWQESAAGNNLLSIIVSSEGDIYFKTTKPYNELRIVFGGLISTAQKIDIFYGFGQTTRPDAEVLPVFYKQFSVKKLGHGVLLNWQINSGEIIGAMMVEKSRDGIHFYTAGYADTNNFNTYSFQDHLVSGSTFYRIKTIAGNKTFYSSIQSINMMQEQVSLNVNNPVRDVLQMELPIANACVYTTQLFNTNGQAVYSMQRSMSGLCHLNLNRSQIKSGIYLLKLTDETGKSFTQKIVLE